MLSLPSSATSRRCLLRSIARWSMRPLTAPSGIFDSSSNTAPPVCAIAGYPSISTAAPIRSARTISSALGDIDVRQRRLQAGREFLGIVIRPEMHKEKPGLFVEHMVVDGGYLDAVLPQSF